MYTNEEIKEIKQKRIDVLQGQVDNIDALAENFNMTEEQKVSNLKHWKKEIKKAQKVIDNI